MVIANPLSDTVFKWLMADNRIARFFIQTLLEEIVTEVEVKPQELVYDKEGSSIMAASFAIFRLDYVATIKLATGEYKKVLIEIQKAKNITDIMRFRNYLGKHYMKEDEVVVDGVPSKAILPIVTIYLLGFKLPEIDTPAVKVSRQYINQINHQVITQKNDFIEKLTHDNYIVQIPRIDGKIQTSLEQVLSFFEQKYYIDDAGMLKEYPYPIVDEDMKLIADALHYAGLDPIKRRMIETENEAYRVYLATTKELQEKLDIEQKARLSAEQAFQDSLKAQSKAQLALDESEKEKLALANELAELKRKLGTT